MVDPALNAAMALQQYQGHIRSDSDINSTITEVRRITQAVKGGDLSDLEGMLVGQAIALQTLSTNLAHRAREQSLQRHFEAFLGLSFKAQAQSRSTIQALVDLKFPRQVVYAKNVSNINSGQQQINNGVPAQAGEKESDQNKLLENRNGEWMDTGATRPTGRADPELATVGEVHRPSKRARKVQGVS
ncbi:hypothetical protein SRS16CHR_02577 [Variovorax sp. SRS16]|nr:hypothetical protein SRS16CHR_02577 [Variovorax sp. SRS16]